LLFRRANLAARVTGAQIRMARAALRWTAADLGERAGLSRNAVNPIERGGAAMVPTLIKLQTALELLR
jgi:transcriptional regulator with XRE-family HTH domain